VPASLAGRPLKDSGIGSRTGLSVVALQQGDELVAPLTGDTILPKHAELLMLGSMDQRRFFLEAFDPRQAKRVPRADDDVPRARAAWPSGPGDI
jgi:K+/H+ antiporter YhaU regulatory subunit KhtT